MTKLHRIRHEDFAIELMSGEVRVVPEPDMQGRKYNRAGVAG